jgi:hypothetical protein
MNTEENACLLDRFDSTRLDSQDTEFRTWRAADDEDCLMRGEQMEQDMYVGVGGRSACYAGRMLEEPST